MVGSLARQEVPAEVSAPAWQVTGIVFLFLWTALARAVACDMDQTNQSFHSIDGDGDWNAVRFSFFSLSFPSFVT